MPRKKVQDITPEQRSIRQVSIDKKKPRVKQRSGPKPLEERSINARRTSSKGLWFIAGIAVVFLFFLFSLVFSGAQIVTYPKQAAVALGSTYEAEREPEDDNRIVFEVMTINQEGSRDVESSGTVFKEEPASGIITIYNDYSTQEQRLIKNTRFESPEGLIFRIRESIVVPGQKESGNPGTIDVRVYADEPGESYNIGVTDFTVPGFEGSPQFDSFYAQSKTPMTGGFSGELRTVSETTREETVANIQNELREALFNQAQSQVPEGFVLYNDAMLVSFESLLDEETGDNQVRLTEKATLEAIIFNEKDLSRFLAEKSVAEYDGGDVNIQNIDSLQFTLENKEEVQLGSSDPLQFTLDGNADIVWTFNEETLKESFVAKNKSEIDSILASYPGIERAEVIIRPFWKRSFPDKATKIKVEKIVGNEEASDGSDEQ